MNAKQRAAELRIYPFHHLVPLPDTEPGARTEDGDQIAVRYRSAPYSNTPGGEVVAVAVVHDDGGSWLYPVPDREPHAMFTDLPVRARYIATADLPEHVTDALRSDVQAHQGYLVDDDNLDEGTLLDYTARLYDLPFILVRLGAATILARTAANTTLAWRTAEAFRRMGMTAPLSLADDLAEADRPVVGVSFDRAQEIRYGIQRAVDEAIAPLLMQRHWMIGYLP